jgi:hypothetical protein
MSHYLFQKTFRRESEAGQVFHWLRVAFAQNLRDAVAGAVLTCYLPRVYAASGETNRVNLALQRSQLEFEHWLSLVDTIAKLEKPPPVRVHIRLQLPMDRSDLGKTLTWLAQSGETALDLAIIDAVRLLFLPVSKAAVNAPDVSLVIAKTRLVVRQRFDIPGHTCLPALPTTLPAGAAPPAQIPLPAGRSTLSSTAEPEVDLNLDFDF